jgi:hypothetical protein
MRHSFRHLPRITLVLLAFVPLARAEPDTPPAPPTSALLARRMLDSEALYTLTGGLKPVSEGFWRTRFPKDEGESPLILETRRALEALPLDPAFEVGVLVFARANGEWRHASAFVAHRPSLQALIRRRSDVFAPLGITVTSPAWEVLERIDQAPDSHRWRGFGLMFGYPDYAVEFFVEAGKEKERTQEFVKREFVNLPTFVSDRGRFVYAVPLGHVLRREDLDLRCRVEIIFNHYLACRGAFISEEEGADHGALPLLADWSTRFSIRQAIPPVQLESRPPTRIRPRPGIRRLRPGISRPGRTRHHHGQARHGCRANALAAMAAPSRQGSATG